MKTKKAFALIEVMAVLFFIAILLLPLTRLARLTTYDLIRSCKLIEVNTSILDAVKHTRKDVNAAVNFPKSFDTHVANEHCLLIQQQNKIICYLLNDEKISRLEIPDNSSGNIETVESDSWHIPNGKIEWHVLRKNDIGYAVEVKKYVEYQKHPQAEKKMTNSYMYFANAYREAVN